MGEIVQEGGWVGEEERESQKEVKEGGESERRREKLKAEEKGECRRGQRT